MQYIAQKDDSFICVSLFAFVHLETYLSMTKTAELPSPSEQVLVSPTSEHNAFAEQTNSSGKVDKVQMKKQLGLLEGVAIILGIIFGSGEIFRNIYDL